MIAVGFIGLTINIWVMATDGWTGEGYIHCQKRIKFHQRLDHQRWNEKMIWSNLPKSTIFTYIYIYIYIYMSVCVCVRVCVVEWLNTPSALYQRDWLIAINSLRLKTLRVDLKSCLIFGLIILRLALLHFVPPQNLVNSFVNRS